MFYEHSDNQRTISVASLSGLGKDCRSESRRSRTHPAPLADQHAVAGRFHLEPHVAAAPSGPFTFQTPAALVFDFDDLAHGLPVAERIMATAATETGANRDAVCIT